jgi:hypothetical protein
LNLHERFRLIPFRLASPRIPADQQSPQAAPWRTERSGNFAGFVVSAWRCTGLAIWYLKVWSQGDDQDARSFTVAAAGFYPETVVPAEKFAILYLIAMWEAEGS